jgi:predicted helicase
MRAFKHSDLDDKGLHQAFGIRVKKGWSIRKAWQKLQSVDDGQMQEYIQSVLYRPFDVRYIFYHDAVVWRTVKRVMRHMLAGGNLGLITARSNKSSVMDHFFITDKIMETKCGESTTQSALFPLYLYPSAESPDAFHQVRRPNLAEWLLPKLSTAYGFTPAPEEVLAYIYAVLYSPTYRQKYAQELRTDFPRVPFTANADLFRQMAALGQRLIALHLLQSPELNPPVAKYQGTGSNDTVERVKYDEATSRVYINADKCFEGITPQMWAYQIGGYQVLAKYLKDRKGRRMDDPVRYIHIATAIARTMDLQREIDQIYHNVEINVVPVVI